MRTVPSAAMPRSVGEWILPRRPTSVAWVVAQSSGSRQGAMGGALPEDDGRGVQERGAGSREAGVAEGRVGGDLGWI